LGDALEDLRDGLRAGGLFIGRLNESAAVTLLSVELPVPLDKACDAALDGGSR